MTKLAYSYIRFSQLSQAKGGSLVRQVELAEEYAAKHGMTLDTTLKMRDLGKSGFSGKNVTDGALGNFVKAIEKEIVPAGSYLLIEDIDRLSRLPVMEALAVFQSIINGGVIVVILKDGKHYSKESLKVDWIDLMPILVSMGRAHEESQRKSVHLSKAWKAKKAAAVEYKTPLGNNAPRWLTYTKEDGYKEIPEAVETVKRIFQLSIEGKGRNVIAKILASEGIKPFKAKSWGSTQISRILSSRSVLGEYHPNTLRKSDNTPVMDYFPQIIDENTFNQAYAANRGRYIHRVTKKTKDFNIWVGIAKCFECNSSMYCISKGKAPKGHRYLSCSQNRNKMCSSKPVRYDASELIFREILVKVGDKSIAEDKSADDAKKLQILQGSLQIAEAKHTSTISIFEDEPSKSLGNIISKQEAAIDQLKEEIESLKVALAADTIIDKDAFFASVDLESYNGRNEANELLKRLNITVKVNGLDGHYGVDQDGVRILDIIDNKTLGICFYPASHGTSRTVWDQEGTFTPRLTFDPDFIEDEHI